MNSYLLALQAGGAPGWLGIAPLIFIFAIFYLVLILPQQRKQKKWQAMLGQIKTGDKVVTSGGLHGVIVALKDDYVHLRVPPDRFAAYYNAAQMIAGAQVVEHVAQRGGALHEVMYRAEHGGVRGGRDAGGGDRGGDQANVVPAVCGDAVGRHLQHLLGGVDPDDGPGGADLVLQQR
jgi:preprotein translocase subunit YajC